MSNSTTPDISQLLPPSLNLSEHLSAHKYFFVCTLTVAAWDTLVLSPRAWRLLKTKEWPILKILFHLLRLFMPAEFVIVAVAFYDTRFTQSQCSHFFLFEPICTAILMAAVSIVHVIRIHAIYDRNRTVLAGMIALFAIQVVCMGIACGFYRSVPLLDGQGCIAGPKHSWVGIYWLSATVFFTVSFALAVNRSLQTLAQRPITYWKLMLRDGLNLYGAIQLVNMINVIYWFVVQPEDNSDTIKTIVTSMAAVLSTTMTLRIILSVRGSLVSGGSFAGSSHGHSSAGSRGAQHGMSPRYAAGAPNISSALSAVPGHTYTIGGIGGPMVHEDKTKDWEVHDGKSSYNEGKEIGLVTTDEVAEGDPMTRSRVNHGVKVTVDRQIE